MTLDDFIPNAWPPEAAATLDSWRQGHLFRCDNIAWLADGGTIDFVTKDDNSGEPAGLLSMGSGIAGTGYFAVISQTCDIAAEGPGAKHGFVQIAPVRDIDVFGDEKIELIRAGEVVEYVYLTQPPIAGVNWAVDLRATVLLSKAALSEQEPTIGFASESDELGLGAAVAAKYERPALHNYLAKTLPDALATLVHNARKREHEWWENVEQFRLHVEGPRLNPTRVRLIVVTDINFNGRFHRDLGKQVRTFWTGHRKALKKNGIDAMPVAFKYIDDYKTKDYRSTLPINVPALGRGRFA